MSGELNKNGGGIEAVVQKLDALSTDVDTRFTDVSASVDSRFAALAVSLDERFSAVDEALAEQRQYTEFAFDRLRDEMRDGFGAINKRLDGHDSRFTSIDRRFNSIDRRFNSIDSRFDSIDSRFDRLERKLDQFFDTQSRTNELVERRLNRSRRRPARDK